MWYNQAMQCYLIIKKNEVLIYYNKITADGDCSHEIKRCLLSGRKAMTNLGSVLKSRKRDYFANKNRQVKAMVFPVVMYGCDSRTIKKDQG